jgi:hypothetical protein
MKKKAELQRSTRVLDRVAWTTQDASASVGDFWHIPLALSLAVKYKYGSTMSAKEGPAI